MTSGKSLPARFQRLKSGHVPVATYILRFSHRLDDMCWWCVLDIQVSARDGDVLYGQRRRCLVWPEMLVSHMAGDDCWLWYELIAFSRTGAFIYILA